MSAQQPSDKKKRNVGLKATRYFRTRISPFAMTLVIMGGQTWIAYMINLGFVWLLPIATGIMLVSSILAYSVSHEPPSRAARALSIAVVALLTIINMVCIGWFIYDMLNPETVTVSHELLLSGFALWVVNIGVFALAYWELDTGGPDVRVLGLSEALRNNFYPDFVFEQYTTCSLHLSPDDWTPGFIDYLYLSISTATSFGPSVPAPSTSMAKLMAGAEALISMFILGLIVARAMSL